jgi:DNA polymerase III subunit epsilon
MLKHFPLPCVIVDIETTGGNVTYDRITEIGIIEVTENGVTEWSTLINPRTQNLALPRASRAYRKMPTKRK